MKLESKFDLGQRVYLIRRLSQTIGVPCETCGGTGRLALVNGGTVRCTEEWGRTNCRDGKIRHELVFRWAPAENLTVGRICIYAYQNPDKDYRRNKVEYMCEETGVGSGSLYYEDDLFATRKEAEAECVIRNVGWDTLPSEHTIRAAYEEDEDRTQRALEAEAVAP